MEGKSGLSLNLSYCGNSTRYVIMIVSILALSFVLANTLAMNFTVICMYKDAPLPPSNNSTDDPELLYSTSQQGWLFSATAIGNIIGTLPLPYSTNHLGVRKTFTFYGFISGVSTLILPLLVPMGFPFVFLIRIIQGFSLAISFSALGAIVTAWSTIEGSGTYIALLSCHFQSGAIIAMVLGGEFCSNSYGWTMTYYILGVATLLSFTLFFFFYRDAPSLHKNVSDKELNKISHGKVPVTKDQHKIPYKAILTDLPVIGIIVSCFGGCMGVQTLFQYGPIYLNKVLGFDAKETGIAAALPFILSIAVKFGVGPFSNLFTFLSERGKIIFFNSLSQIPMCLCFLSMALLPPNMIWLIQIAYSLVNAFAGLSAVGISKSITLVSAHHAHFVMTFCSFINSLVILFLPFFISTLAPDNSSQQWSRIFWTLTIFIFMTLMFFNFTARASPRPWTMHPPPSSKVSDESEHTRRYSIDSFIVRL